MPHAQPLRTGDLDRLGEYVVVGRLGEGGQGVVYLGAHPATGSTPYAIKLLHGPLGEDEAVFLREVELAKQVARFCTAQVIEAGLAGDRPFIVSEYVDGPSLHREVRAGGPRGGGALERLAVGTATALAAIHRAGIVHRDFKPQNVLLGPDGPRVIDFGLARALDAGATQSGRGAGTPAYMAPEQVEGAEIRAAADVFSWGATVCFAANAQAPFGQDSIAAVLHRVLTAPPELGRLDGRLGELVAGCLEKDPRNRPTSRELLLALLGDGDVRPAEPGSPPAAGPAVPGLPPAVPPGPAPPGRFPPASRLRDLGGAPDESAEPRTRPGRAATRASVAVSGALLVSAAVLVAVLVPALSGNGEPVGPGRPGGSAAATGVRSGPTSQPARAAPPARHPAGTGARSAPLPSPDPSAPPAVAGVAVPALAGLDRPEALSLIEKAGLVAGVLTSADSDRRVGQVLSSRPEARTVVARGTRIDLEVSAGVAVPVLAGLPRRQAETALVRAGLVPGEITARCSAEPAGRVLASAPGAAERVSSGSAVALVVSRRGAEVPSVVGQREADARSALSAAGFAVRVRPRLVGDPSRSGVVLAQGGASGPCARPDAVVVITVGVEGQTGPGPDPDPDPGETTVPVDPTVTDRPGRARDVLPG
ncbi:Serine/threonine protein kinase [Streptosporangium canum]|uniref:non-specific serine/threonine protein kinase n=1 Tax=Streptosporangium canum TaxID=324952 RepID=A0A1I3TZ02_9ACTN|nr:serine/threonine-protein kinase [Streptosporangium canum]SFJ76494.1 Serine/threonine protein kinase [Streptosporangium canum]